jgi:glycosyltransferase involved in cell wall biosynthesis
MMRRVRAGSGAVQTPAAHLFPHFNFIAAAVAWVKACDIKVVVIGISYQEAHQLHVRELYKRLQENGVNVGLFHYDISIQVRNLLKDQYVRTGSSWQEISDKVQSILKKLFQNRNYFESCYAIGSPLMFEPDFVISCSDWSGCFIDPENRIPHYVMHQYFDPNYWREKLSEESLLPVRDVLMVNPQRNKGPEVMLNLIRDAPGDYTFRVLKGGWGEAFATFLPELEKLPPSTANRVEALEYVKDIRGAYQATRALLFPSTYEGYGMVGVEPMFAGTPVVSSNYPAVCEAVGEGALTLCPFRSSRADWLSAIEEVLNNPDHWRGRALRRAAELEARQERELSGLITFLGQFA